MKKTLFPAILASALCLMACKEEMPYENSLEYTYGIWPGSRTSAETGGGCFHFIDSVFTSWTDFESCSVHAKGKTADEWYANGDMQVEQLVTDAGNKARDMYKALQDAATLTDLGSGSYSRSGIYFFFDRNLGKDSANCISKIDFDDFTYFGGIRDTTDLIQIYATDADSATVAYREDLDADVRATRRQFKVCTPDRRIYTGNPFITKVTVLYNGDESRNEIRILFNCTETTLKELVSLYGSDWYLLTFMDLTDGSGTSSDQFAAYTPLQLITKPE